MILVLIVLSVLATARGENLKLDHATFDTTAKDGFTFVKFYAPWCGHCTNMKQDWIDLEKHFTQNGDLKIGEVDCTENKELCAEQGVQGYPTILLFRKGHQLTKYQNNRNLESMRSFLDEQLSKTHEDSPVEAEKAMTNDLSKTFDATIKEGLTFVKFFAPWCGHCKSMAKDWTKLEKHFSQPDTGSLSVGSVDCDESKALCHRLGIKGYPTVLLFKDGKQLKEYEAPRDFNSMKNFLDDQLNPTEKAPMENGVHVLSSSNFDTSIQEGFTFVKFFAPWCGHCKSMASDWIDLEQFYTEQGVSELKIAEVDCTVSKSLCAKHSVEGYPTVMLFKDGVKHTTYDGNRHFPSMKSFLNEKLGREEEEVKKQESPNAVDGNNFDTTIKEGLTFVKFFAPWCGHCKSMAQDWIKLEKKFKGELNFVEIDCIASENEQLCAQHSIETVPTLLFFKNGEKQKKYEEKKTDLESMTSFVEKQLGPQETGEEVIQEIKQIEDEQPIKTQEEPPVEAEIVKTNDKNLKLDHSTFDHAIKDGFTFVKFFAPWCGHCTNMAQDWIDLEKHFTENGDLKIGEVDCTVSKKLCDEQGVKGYPTILLFRKGQELTKYQNNRNLESMKSFLDEQLAKTHEDPPMEAEKPETNDLSKTFDATIKEGFTLVKFFAPWCGHCKRMAKDWTKLQQHYSQQDTGSLSVGSVDCDESIALCQRLGIKRYPTVLLFKDGKQLKEYEAPRDFDSMKNFLDYQLNPTEKAPMENGVHVLSSSNFDTSIKEGFTFVKFFAPWCGHCKSMASDWIDLEQFYTEQGVSELKIAEVDCTVSQSLCAKHSVEGYPTVMLFKDGVKHTTYDGNRHFPSMKSFLNEKLGRKEEEEKKQESPNAVDSNNFGATIKKGLTFVKFFAPWCGHCKAMAEDWVKLENKYEGELKFVEIDCTVSVNEELCAQHNIETVPTLLFFKNGEKQTRYAEKTTDLDSMTSFVDKQLGRGPQEELEEVVPETKQIGVYTLTDDNFDAIKKTGFTFVKFFAPWCGHCKNMAQDWEKLEQHYTQHGVGELKIGEVDCTVTPSLCAQQSIPGYPTIVLFKDGDKHTEYAFYRDFDRMKLFLDETLGRSADVILEPDNLGVYTLNQNNWKRMHKAMGVNTVIVKFYDPLCKQSIEFKQTYEDLVVEFLMEESEDLAFTEVDCTAADSIDLCKQEDVQEYPAIHLYQYGDLEDIHSGFRTLDYLRNFVWETMDPERMEDPELFEDPMFADAMDVFAKAVDAAEKELDDQDYEEGDDEDEEEEEEEEEEDGEEEEDDEEEDGEVEEETKDEEVQTQVDGTTDIPIKIMPVKNDEEVKEELEKMVADITKKVEEESERAKTTNEDPAKQEQSQQKDEL